MIGVTAVLSGCVSIAWPPFNGGGLAEIAPPERHRIVITAVSTSESELLRQLQDEEAMLERLIAIEARRYAAAETTLAERLSKRIRREIAGTLYSDAARNLIELRDRVDMIDRTLSRARINVGRRQT